MSGKSWNRPYSPPQTMTPKTSKRPRETYQTPSRSPKRLPFSDANSDDDDSMDSEDFEVIHFDPDCILEDPDLEETDNESEEWDSLESCMEEEEEEFFDAIQAMETDSLDDELSSSEGSIDPDCISTDDEEAMEEYLIYRHARRQRKRAMRRFHRLGEDEFDEIDQVNMRYLFGGVPSKKPCTMTSAAGPDAHLNMRRFVIPAREMLRNYFRSLERNWMRRVKENACAGKVSAAKGKAKSVRNVLSEKN